MRDGHCHGNVLHRERLPYLYGARHLANARGGGRLVDLEDSAYFGDSLHIHSPYTHMLCSCSDICRIRIVYSNSSASFLSSIHAVCVVKAAAATAATTASHQPAPAHALDAANNCRCCCPPQCHKCQERQWWPSRLSQPSSFSSSGVSRTPQSIRARQRCRSASPACGGCNANASNGLLLLSQLFVRAHLLGRYCWRRCCRRRQRQRQQQQQRRGGRTGCA